MLPEQIKNFHEMVTLKDGTYVLLRPMNGDDENLLLEFYSSVNDDDMRYFRHYVKDSVYTILSIPMNFILIKSFGLMGLAYSNLIALTIYNGVRYVFLWRKFGLQPYTITHLYILAGTILLYGCIYYIPQSNNLYIDILVRSIAFLALFMPIIHYTRVAPDLSDFITAKLKALIPGKKRY